MSKRKELKSDSTSEEIDAVGHRFGNFHNYYSFHPAEERTKLFPNDFVNKMWYRNGCPNKFHYIDIGCNDGTLSMAIFNLIKYELPNIECYLLGIDLDEELIQSATTRYSGDRHINFLSLNIMDKDSMMRINDYQTKLGIHKFHLVTLFSTTMWIHLHYGDDGLYGLLRLTANLSCDSVIIEPQPWKCYRSASKRCRKLGLDKFPYNNSTLHIRDDIEHAIKDIMTANEFGSCVCLGQEIWSRSMLLFSRFLDDTKNPLADDKRTSEDEVMLKSNDFNQKPSPT